MNRNNTHATLLRKRGIAITILTMTLFSLTKKR